MPKLEPDDPVLAGLFSDQREVTSTPHVDLLTAPPTTLEASSYEPTSVPEEINQYQYADVTTEVPTTSAGIGGFMDKLLNSASSKTSKERKAPRVPKAGSTANSESNAGGLTPGGRSLQPKRSSKQVDDDRLYDGTQLHAAHHGYFVHRDYAAHFFRWGFVAQRIKPGMRILDVGCGQDLPLPRVISAPNVYPNCKPSAVVCCDWNPIDVRFNPAWLTVHPQFDFCKQWPGLVGSFLNDGSYCDLPECHFDIIVNLEVIEHMDPTQGDELLAGMRYCLKPGGQIILSTPVFNGLAAANHIHEYGARELYDKLTSHGLVVVERYGTFANLNDLKKVMSTEYWELAKLLRRWYANDVISCFLAPLFPDASRNNCWVLMRQEDLVAGYQPPVKNVEAEDESATGQA